MALGGCAAFTRPPLASGEAAVLVALRPVDLLLFGEQHDAPEHARLQRRLVEALAARGALAALVLEMAEQGRSTAGLAREADEDQVRATLAWQDAAWPWTRYGPVVMAAQRAGVPVLGANLPRAQIAAAAQDAALEAGLDPAALARQQALIREGHCGLLPEPRLPAMARVQIARDLAMARTLAQARRPGQTVLLVAGGAHVRRDLGVPRHLPAAASLQVVLARADDGAPAPPREALGLADGDLLWPTPALPPRDACAELRERLTRP